MCIIGHLFSLVLWFLATAARAAGARAGTRAGTGAGAGAGARAARARPRAGRRAGRTARAGAWHSQHQEHAKSHIYNIDEENCIIWKLRSDATLLRSRLLRLL